MSIGNTENPLRRRRVLLGAATALVSVAAGVPGLAAIAATGSGSTPTAPASAGPVLLPTTPTNPVQELFPGSFLDQSVTNQPVADNSAALVSNFATQTHTIYKQVGVGFKPIFTVPANQPLVHVSASGGCWQGFLATFGQGVPIPAGAYNSGTSDENVIVSQPSTGGDWELWKATNTNGQWSACWGGGLNALKSTGVFPYPFGESASGISYLATTITEADVASGQIDHAINLQIETCNGFIAPANRTDCGSNPGTPSEGTWFRMPANVAMPAGMTPFAQMVFQALQTYGAIVTDHAGAVMITAENPNDWSFQGNAGADPILTSFAGSPEYSVLNGMPWAQLQVIVPPGP
jgi:hypothetical protein